MDTTEPNVHSTQTHTHKQTAMSSQMNACRKGHTGRLCTWEQRTGIWKYI